MAARAQLKTWMAYLQDQRRSAGKCSSWSRISNSYAILDFITCFLSVSIFPSLREPHVMGHSIWIPTLFGFSRICCQLGPTCIRIGPQRGRAAKSGGHPGPETTSCSLPLLSLGPLHGLRQTHCWYPVLSLVSFLLSTDSEFHRCLWAWQHGLTDRQQRRWTDCSDDGGWLTSMQAPGGPATH